MSYHKETNIELLLSNIGRAELLRAIQKTISGLKNRLTVIKDLYARISKTNNPNEILELLINAALEQAMGWSILEQLPAVEHLIKNPDDKNWRVNILLVITQELHRVADLWEYLEGEFSDLEYEDDKYILDKLISIHNREIIELIKQNTTQNTKQNN